MLVGPFLQKNVDQQGNDASVQAYFENLWMFATINFSSFCMFLTVTDDRGSPNLGNIKSR